jgi:hypothetical protein
MKSSRLLAAAQDTIVAQRPVGGLMRGSGAVIELAR